MGGWSRGLRTGTRPDPSTWVSIIVVSTLPCPSNTGPSGCRVGPAAFDHTPVRPTSRREAILTWAGAGLGTASLALSYALAWRLDVTQYRADHDKQRGLFDADLARNAELVRDADAAVLV